MNKELESKIAGLEQRLELLSDQLRKALEYIENDPHSSLSKSRIILEHIVFSIYKLEMDQEPRKLELGAVLNDNQFTRKIDRRIVSRMNSIRDMCNLGVHGEKVGPGDAKNVLDNLCEVLEWYFENYKAVKDGNFKRDIDKYEDWVNSLEKGLLDVQIDTLSQMDVGSLAEILFEVMDRKEFSVIDSRNAQICLLELINNVKFHVKNDTRAGVKISFIKIGYKRYSVSIEVRDKGPGFDLEKMIIDAENRISKGEREHGILRAFRLGSELSQTYDEGSIVVWRKKQTRRVPGDEAGDKEVIIIKYDFGYPDELCFNNEFYCYQDFINLIRKFQGSLLLSNYDFYLTNSIKITLDFLRKDPRNVVCLEFHTSHPTMVLSAEEFTQAKKSFYDFDPPVPSLCNILYKYISEITPEKQLRIACFTDTDEDHQYLKQFCRKNSLDYFESEIVYSEFKKNPQKRSGRNLFLRFLKK